MTTISQRATAMMPEREQPLSEQYRIIAKQWVDAEAAYKIMHDTKNSVRADMMRKVLDDDKTKKVNRAEIEVEASDEWTNYLTKMNELWRDANLKRAQLKYIDMRFQEWMNANANNRHEARLGR